MFAKARPFHKPPKVERQEGGWQAAGSPEGTARPGPHVRLHAQLTRAAHFLLLNSVLLPFPLSSDLSQDPQTMSCFSFARMKSGSTSGRR